MRYIITLDTTPSHKVPYGKRRLRMMLKTLWRGWQMRCVSVAPARDAEAGEGNHTTPRENAVDEQLEGQERDAETKPAKHFETP